MARIPLYHIFEELNGLIHKAGENGETKKFLSALDNKNSKEPEAIKRAVARVKTLTRKSKKSS